MPSPVVCPGEAAMAARVTVDHVTKWYGRLAALSDVSLSVRPGEVLGLIGPNGAGKTTLFECVAGVLPCETGTISVDGRPIAAKERSSFIFYMPDGIAPWPAQPLKWALDFTLGFFGGAIERRDEVIARLGLEPLLHSAIGSLSKGQRKRALLAIGMLTPHPLFLVDEPFDGLDLRQTREVAAAIRAHAAGGRTVFLSIHQISDAARVCDRFVLISGGRACAEGTLEELLARAGAAAPSAPSSLEDVVLALT
jgi:ABC-2 type transport system ATP-binding protein